MLDDLPYESMAETLMKITAKFKRPNGDLMQIAEKAGLIEPITKLFDTFFAPGKTKKCAYWHYGAPNTGKTCFSELLEKMFYCQRLTYEKGEWPTVSETG